MGQRFLALYWPEGLEGAKVLDGIDDLARKDGRSRSWVIREAMKEYLSQHYPGNPQTDIRTFAGVLSPPKTLQKSSRKIDQRDVRWLMKSKKWPKVKAIKYLKSVGYKE